jgi:hypothetical protein
MWMQISIGNSHNMMLLKDFKVVFYLSPSRVYIKGSYVYYKGFLVGIHRGTDNISYDHLARQLVAKLTGKEENDIYCRFRGSRKIENKINNEEIVLKPYEWSNLEGDSW